MRILNLSISTFLITLSLITFNGTKVYSDPVTKAEFKAALRLYVQNIPDLGALWRYPQYARSVFLSGGVLRGAIHDLKAKIDRYGLNGALRMPTLNTENLLLQGWSDKDIIAPDSHKDWVQSHFNEQWDIITPDFMNDSVAIGGTTLEKVQVNPWEVIDPFNAINDYLEGHLVFEYGRNVNSGKIFGNTHLALGLRFLRMSLNLPEASITEKSWLRLRQIKNLEWDTISRGTNSDYWILKGLKKLFHATHQEVATFIGVLKNADLLTLLEHHHFSLPPDQNLDVQTISNWLLWHSQNLSLEEKMAAAQIMGRATNERIHYLSQINLTVDERGRQEIAALKTRLLRYDRQYGGENHVKPVENAMGLEVKVNGVKVQVKPGQVLQNGALRFEVPIQVNGQNHCGEIIIKIGA